MMRLGSAEKPLCLVSKKSPTHAHTTLYTNLELIPDQFI